MIRIDVESFKQCFKEKEGVVINTFHGVKGEGIYYGDCFWAPIWLCSALEYY